MLKRELLDGKKTVVFIGLNPSKANSSNNDRTLTRIINFCSRWNYKNIYVINLFGIIAKSPSQLLKSKDPIGLNNDLIDEDAMGSNSDTAVPTQQSVKAYVDARYHYQYIHFVGKNIGSAKVCFKNLWKCIDLFQSFKNLRKYLTPTPC